MNSSTCRGILVACAVLVVLAGCSRGPGRMFTLNDPPTVELTVAPGKGDSTGYAVHLEWRGADTDGHVTGYQYAIDPPAMSTPGNDTLWVDTQALQVDLVLPATRPVEPLPPPGQPAESRDYHTVVVRAIDDDGRRSAPVSRSFTAWTVAPFTTIVSPRPTSQLATGTPTVFRVQWVGNDPDGPAPVTYKLRLARADEIDPADPTSITSADIQAFFGADAPGFAAAGWDSLPGDTTSRVLAGLVPYTRYFLAIVAVDVSGAYEPRFSRDSNVLDFVPTLDALGPRIRVFNEFISRTQTVPGISLDPSRTIRFEYPVDAPLTINWVALQSQPGLRPAGTRWALDIADIYDETPRSGPGDLAHWSEWSDSVTSATVGPFTIPPAGHVFSIEARDELGNISLLTIAILLVEPNFDSPLLVIDDLYGTPTQLRASPSFPGEIILTGPYPMEAEQDSFYVARGGFPDSLGIRSGTPGALSLPGVFAEFAPDTLDYRFHPFDGVELSTLSRYRAVCWYTDAQSAARNGSKFGSVVPMTGLRAINSANRLNTLAIYLRQGGSVWLFGEGTTSAIANGYWSRYSFGGAPPPLPYTSGDDPRQHVLVPGNFLYDFVHLRSELTVGGGSTFPATQLVACQPFLPASFPLEPGAARTALRWPDLPRLTIAAYRGAAPQPGLLRTFVIHAPLVVADLDTLYTYEARVPDPGHVYAPGDVDGYPNAIHYDGTDNGPGSQLVWFGFPLHYFDREQVRDVVGAVMRNFGIERAAPRAGRGRVAGR
ncbi:MAG: hypothetical protein ABIP29_00445 [Candidatus Eisenbacteria bacterium]